MGLCDLDSMAAPRPLESFILALDRIVVFVLITNCEVACLGGMRALDTVYSILDLNRSLPPHAAQPLLPIACPAFWHFRRSWGSCLVACWPLSPPRDLPFLDHMAGSGKHRLLAGNRGPACTLGDGSGADSLGRLCH